MDVSPETLRRFAARVARKAGALLLRRAGTGRYSLKGRRNLVTAADRESERLIVRRIRERFPDHGVFGEEGGRREGRGAWEWIVDPLDGTTNYAHGLPAYAISIAAARILPGGRRRVEAAAVFAPRLKELFTAARGGGCRVGGRPARVSRTADLRSSLLATGFAYDRNETPDDNVANFGRLVMEARDLRRLGVASYDLASVAAGRFDGFWELHLAPWDKAAGALLVAEAGGRVTDGRGGPDWLEGPCIVATNGRIHDALRRRLAPLHGQHGAGPSV